MIKKLFWGILSGVTAIACIIEAIFMFIIALVVIAIIAILILLLFALL